MGDGEMCDVMWEMYKMRGAGVGCRGDGSGDRFGRGEQVVFDWGTGPRSERTGGSDVKLAEGNAMGVGGGE
jgi:hypothetical protein